MTITDTTITMYDVCTALIYIICLLSIIPIILYFIGRDGRLTRSKPVFIITTLASAALLIVWTMLHYMKILSPAMDLPVKEYFTSLQSYLQSGAADTVVHSGSDMDVLLITAIVYIILFGTNIGAFFFGRREK